MHTLFSWWFSRWFLLGTIRRTRTGALKQFLYLFPRFPDPPYLFIKLTGHAGLGPTFSHALTSIQGHSGIFVAAYRSSFVDISTILNVCHLPEKFILYLLYADVWENKLSVVNCFRDKLQACESGCPLRKTVLHILS